MASLAVYLNVTNAEKSIAFYEGLGFERRGEPELGENGDIQIQRLAMGDARLAVGQISANPDPDFQKWVSSPLGAGVIVLIVDADHDEVRTKAAALGAEVNDDPDGDPGFLEIVDPDGYSLMFVPSGEV